MTGAAPQSLPDRIRRLRAERGWSAQRLAEECARLGATTLTRGTIAKIESGVRKSVTAAEIDVLGRALGVELNTLVRGSLVVSLMAELYSDEPAARTVLLSIGFPPHLMPSFTGPIEFWSTMVFQLEQGLGLRDGIAALIHQTARQYPGNAHVQALNADLSGTAWAKVQGSDVASLMAELYDTERAARLILTSAGFPPNLMPPFDQPRKFWAVVVHELELGIIDDGVSALVRQAVRQYPGNARAKDFEARLSGAARSGIIALPGTSTPEEPCHTLMLIGADLPHEFLAVVREQLGTDAADLLYVSRQQCAVAIPDLGDNAARLQQQVQELMQSFAPNTRLEVVYEKYLFRPYLYSDLTVVGPDQTRYLLQSVPATLTPHDIAAAITAETRTMNDRQGTELSTAIDAETEDGAERLDPRKTLHDNKVQDKGTLRVAAQALAGGGPIAYRYGIAERTQAQRRLITQLHQYSQVNPDFAVIYLDDEQLPSRIIAELTANGFAPPDNLEDFLAGSERLSHAEYNALPFHQLKPLPIRHHRLTIDLPPLFPTTPPFIVWNTPVFHPNIWPDNLPGYRPGTVFLPQLAQEYTPELNIADLCQTLADLAEYRFYDPHVFPDLPAARWALSRSGQASIAVHASRPATRLPLRPAIRSLTSETATSPATKPADRLPEALDRIHGH